MFLLLIVFCLYAVLNSFKNKHPIISSDSVINDPLGHSHGPVGSDFSLRTDGQHVKIVITA